jgi:hypothetical protein
MTDKRIDRVNLKVGGPIRRPEEAPPIGIPPLLRRFWNFAREMSKRFSKHLMKDREEEFINAIKRNIEKGI